jgi:hypothetical protein
MRCRSSISFCRIFSILSLISFISLGSKYGLGLNPTVIPTDPTGRCSSFSFDGITLASHPLTLRKSTSSSAAREDFPDISINSLSLAMRSIVCFKSPPGEGKLSISSFDAGRHVTNTPSKNCPYFVGSGTVPLISHPILGLVSTPMRLEAALSASASGRKRSTIFVPLSWLNLSRLDNFPKNVLGLRDFSSSARCACSVFNCASAALSCMSKSSALLATSSTFFSAFLASVSAWSADDCARAEASAASCAACLAVVAVNRASFNKMALNVCSWPSALFCNPSNTPSQTTPTPIRSHPQNAEIVTALLNLSNHPNLWGHVSCNISGPSRNTPSATKKADIRTPKKNQLLALCSWSRKRLSSTSIALFTSKPRVLSETDEDEIATKWTIVWLRLLAGLGILFVIAAVACLLMSAVWCHNPSRRK